MSCNRRCRECGCCRCGTCEFFQPLSEFFEDETDERAKALVAGAFDALDAAGVGVCTTDDPILTWAGSTVSASEGWDCWAEGPHREASEVA